MRRVTILRVTILMLCFSLFLCSSFLLYGCIEEKDKYGIESSNTENSNTKNSSSSNSSSNNNNNLSDDQPQPTHKANIELYGSIREVIDDEGDIELLGELKNTGDIDATFCKITFTFKDDEGNNIESDSSFTYVQGTNKTITTLDYENNAVLEPTEPDNIGAFMLFTDIPYKYGIHYDYAIEWREDETSSPDANLIVDGSISSSETGVGFLELSGKIKNTGNAIAIGGYIIFILKDSTGGVIGVAPLNPIRGATIDLPDDGSTDTAVSPHGTGTFTTCSIMLYPSEVSSYDYKIKWLDYHETASSQRMRETSSGFINNPDLIDNIDQYDPKVLWKEGDKETDRLKEELQKGKKTVQGTDRF
jgi:hypothetical protein